VVLVAVLAPPLVFVPVVLFVVLVPPAPPTLPSHEHTDQEPSRHSRVPAQSSSPTQFDVSSPLQATLVDFNEHAPTKHKDRDKSAAPSTD